MSLDATSGTRRPRDIRFQALALYDGWEYAAARRAVLMPTLGSPSPGSGGSAYLRLHAAWRRRLTSLRAAGWEEAADPRRYGYLRNCPPFGVVLSPLPRQCKLAHFCPHCFARLNVVAPLAQLGLVLAAHTAPGLELVAFQARHTGSRTRGLAPLLDQAYAARRSEVDTRGVVAGLTCFTVHSVFPELVVTRRGLLLLPAGYGDGLPEAHVRAATPEALLELGPRALRYPDWPLRYRADQAVALYELLRKRRLLLRYGALRRLAALRRDCVGREVT